jgi:hypothetical protein
MTQINQMLDNVIKNNLVESTDSFKTILSNKISNRLLEAKKAIYSERYDKDLDKNKNGKLDADDFKKMHAKNKKQTCDSSCNEEIEQALSEVLNPSMGIHAYIDDFTKSKNSRFDKDSIDKRRKRAIAAFYADKK